MKKTWLFLLIVILLAACSPAQTESAPDTVTEAVEESTRTPVPLPADTELPAAETDVPAAADDSPMDGCTLQSVLQAPSATEVSRFAPAGPDDWQLGPETAATTIIEYGDFQ